MVSPVLKSWLAIAAAAKANTELLSNLAHQAQQVVLRVAKVCHPQLVVGHASDEMRLIFEAHLLREQILIHGVKIVDFEIHNRAVLPEFCSFGNCQHKANTAAIEKRQSSGGEEMLHSQHITIKLGRPLGVLHDDRDLHNL